MSGTPKSLLSNLTYISVAAATFLLPIFFLPWTSDIFDFNKQYLLYFLVLVGLISFTLRAVLEKRLELVRTPVDIPLLILLAVSLISSIISADRYISFWGELSNLTYGFVPLLFYALYYFLAVNVLQTERQVRTSLLLLIISVFASAAYFILKFAHLIPNLVNWPLWNPISNQNTVFGLLASIGLVFSLGNLMVKKSSGLKHYIFWIPVLALMMAIHVLIGFKTTWTMLALALVLLLIFSIARLEEMKTGWVSVTFAIMVVAIIFSFIGTPRFLIANVPAEISLSYSASWGITRDAITDNFKQFLFGSGPGTFMYDFSRERSSDLNNTIAWNVRFLHPFNNFFELLATTGVLGVIAFLVLLLTAAGAAFMSWFKISGVKTKKGLIEAAKELLSHEGGLYFLVITGWLVLAAAMFFNTFGTVQWWLFFFFSALLFALPFDVSGVKLQKISLRTSPQYSLVSSFVTILVFTGVIVLGVYLGLFYAADVYASAARGQGNIDRAIASLTRAVNLNGGRYQYHLRLAESYVARASEELGKGNAANPNVITELVANAVNESRLATDISPKNVAAWEFLANMYANARALTGEALRFQISALEKSLELEPTNPILHMNLGNAKLAAGNVKEAQDQYKESVRLKPNFVPGYTALALLEEQSGNLTSAIEYMATAAQVAPNDPMSVFNLGRLYYNRGGGDDVRRAEQLFLYAAELSPNYADALWSLGLLNERRGNTSEALRYYRRVQALNPNDTTVRAKVKALIGPPPEEKK